MCRKTLIAVLMLVASLFASCVDKNYDLLNKEIATDVKIEGNTIALPVGGLKPVVLDSLIDVDEIDMLEKGSGGVYTISKSDALSVNEDIDPITLNIDPFEYNDTIDFNKVNIKNVAIPSSKPTVATFSTPSISLEALNSKLPRLESSVGKRFDIPGLEAAQEQLKNYGNIWGGSFDYELPQQQISTGEQSVGCGFEYVLPKEIETIHSIKLGSAADSVGTLVSVVVTNPKALQHCDKKIDFRINFPEIFKLSANSSADQAHKYNVLPDGHSISLEGFVPDGDKTSLSFYVTEISGLDRYINNGTIRIDDHITYVIDYTAGGNVALTTDMTVDDFAFDVEIDVKLSFLDVAGATKEIEVSFNPVEMNFDLEFKDLKYINKINFVEFDESQSCINFATQMNWDLFEAFKLKEGYALRISFPEQLEISTEYSEYKQGVEYNSAKHAFYVYDLGVLADSEWRLAPEKLTLDIEVSKDGKCNVPVKAGVQFVDDKKNPVRSLVLAGVEIGSMVEILDKLSNGDKEASFKMSDSELVIENAVVQTDAISSTLDETRISFSLNEEIPGEIGRIESIGFENEVPITIELGIAGLETLDTYIDLDLNMSLPSFLKLKSNSSDITVGDGHLAVHTSYKPSSGEKMKLEMLCSGMDFVKEFGANGLVPKDSANAKYISYDKDILVDGEAIIRGTEFQSTLLDKDVYFNVKLNIGEIVVKTFHGIYSAEIEEVEENIALDLGEDLEFLKNPDNSLELADPQLELVLTNPIGVPVDIALHIFGKVGDEVIQESEIKTTLKIHPAEYDVKGDSLIPVQTKMFITTDAANGKAGYDNYEVKALGNLLKRIPDSLSLKVEPIIRKDVTHHVDISKPIKLDADYSVIIPLKLNNLSLCYNDTIKDLKVSMEEEVGMFTNVSLCAKMDIINTIPLGLSLEIVPLDEKNNMIEDIEITALDEDGKVIKNTLIIKAGNGENLLAADNVTVAEGLTAQPFEFAIKSAGGDISSLDKLAFSVKAASSSAAGTVGLKGEQGFKISNIVLEVSSDIEMDVKDMNF